MSKIVARKVVTDLLQLDAVKAENGILKNNISLYKGQLADKDGIINIKDSKLSTYERMVNDYDKAQKISDNQIKSLNKQVKWQRFQKTFLGSLFVLATVAFVLKH